MSADSKPRAGVPFLGYWSAERCTMPGYYVAVRDEGDRYSAERGDLHFGPCAPDRWWPLPPVAPLLTPEERGQVEEIRRLYELDAGRERARMKYLQQISAFFKGNAPASPWWIAALGDLLRLIDRLAPKGD